MRTYLTKIAARTQQQSKRNLPPRGLVPNIGRSGNVTDITESVKHDPVSYPVTEKPANQVVNDPAKINPVDINPAPPSQKTNRKSGNADNTNPYIKRIVQRTETAPVINEKVVNIKSVEKRINEIRNQTSVTDFIVKDHAAKTTSVIAKGKNENDLSDSYVSPVLPRLEKAGRTGKELVKNLEEVNSNVIDLGKRAKEDLISGDRSERAAKQYIRPSESRNTIQLPGQRQPEKQQINIGRITVEVVTPPPVNTVNQPVRKKTVYVQPQNGTGLSDKLIFGLGQM
jgi:hypothetical protein